MVHCTVVQKGADRQGEKSMIVETYIVSLPFPHRDRYSHGRGGDASIIASPTPIAMGAGPETLMFVCSVRTNM